MITEFCNVNVVMLKVAISQRKKNDTPLTILNLEWQVKIALCICVHVMLKQSQ